MAVETLATGEGQQQKTNFIPMRYVMAIMGSIGLAIIYGFKVNVSIALLSMVNHTALLDNNKSLAASSQNESASEEILKDGPFIWNKEKQGMILSMYFIGYLLSMIPSGMLAEKFSAKWVMNIAVLLNVIAAVFTPIIASVHYSGFAMMRVIQGCGGGASFPAMHVMIAKWAPPQERNAIGSIVYAGTALGTVIAILLTGLIAADIGWQAVFYIEGGLCLIWCTLWWLIIEDSPADQHKFISSQEKHYILTSLGKSDSRDHNDAAAAAASPCTKYCIPWRKIMTSMPFLAILIAHFCSNCGWYMLLTQLPTYMNEVLHFNLKTNASLSSLPYFCMWIFTLLLSNILTWFQRKDIMSMTISRKIATLIASVVPMICLVAVSYVDNAVGAVTLMTIGVTSIGGMYCGFLANHIDIAPNFAGTLVAITNAAATIPGIVIPIVVGHMTSSSDPNEKNFAWKIIFFITAAFYVIEIIVYWIFGTAIEQPWNKIEIYNREDSYPTQILPLKKNEE